MEFLSIPPHIAFRLLAFYTWSSEWTWTIADYSKRLAAAVLSVFGPRLYYFFRDHTDYPTPFLANTVNVTATRSADVEWVYNADTKQFWPYGLYKACKGVSTENDCTALPLLSLEVVGIDDTVLADLTDFLEEVQVVGKDVAPPTLSHLLSIWTLSSGIVLNLSQVKCFRYLNSDAEDVEVDGKDWLGASLVKEAAAVDISGNHLEAVD